MCWTWDCMDLLQLPGMSWDIYQDVLARTACVRMHHLMGCPEIPWDVQGHNRMCWSWTWDCMDILELIQMSWDIF